MKKIRQLNNNPMVIWTQRKGEAGSRLLRVVWPKSVVFPCRSPENYFNLDLYIKWAEEPGVAGEKKKIRLNCAKFLDILFIESPWKFNGRITQTDSVVVMNMYPMIYLWNLIRYKFIIKH